jgi:hypothetical protein
MRRKKKVYELFSTANLKELCKKFDVFISILFRALCVLALDYEIY